MTDLADLQTDDVTAIVLAGGRSRRMGRDKAALVLGGRTLLQRAVDAASEAACAVVVVGGPEQLLPPVTSAVPVTVVRDHEAGLGPLAGIVTGLETVRTPFALVVACDMPFVSPVVLQLLAAAVRDGAVVALPVVDGQPQPLCSVIRIEVLATLRDALASGARAASVLADIPGARLLAPSEWNEVDEDGTLFVGVNTPEEWARAEAIEARHGTGA